MKPSRWIRYLGVVVLGTNVLPVSLSAQDSKDDLFTGGVYVRVGYTKFDMALLLDEFGNNEIPISQAKKMVSFGIGVAAVPLVQGIGLNLGANFWTTSLENFRIGTSLYDPIYKDISYSMLLFDLDLYLTPISGIPVAFTFGLGLGCSFQGYTFTSDIPNTLLNAGDKSHTMFRYGTTLGCKITPWKYFSIDFEYRPMSSYSTTQGLEFLYSDGTYNYYKRTGEKKEGPSEKVFSLALSLYVVVPQ